MPIRERLCPVAGVTGGPFLHFFGYYDKSPWDATGRYLLAMRVAFMDRPPTAEDIAVVGMVDLKDACRWRPLAETVAWNWQQGSMLRWMPSAPDREIIFNTRTPQGYGATVLNVKTGESRHLTRPVYALSPDERYAVTLNFSRLYRTRPGYGYVGVPDAWEDESAPAEDGIYYLDLDSGTSRLIVSLARVREIEYADRMASGAHWFNHLQFNPSGTRFVFLHRWRSPEGGRWTTRLFTASHDGSGIAFLGREGIVSHFDWRDDHHILAWSRHGGEDHYHLYEDESDRVHVVGADVLDRDGHCSYSPNRRWILTDTYPDRTSGERTLILYHPETNTRFDVGRFDSAPQISGEIRCDLHPRWSRDGQQVCIDSIHEGERQVYVVDVSSIVGPAA
jgi:hypothetical protein